MLQDLKPLMQRLGYQFQDRRWLENALKHRSYGKENNERLEFLGDSILNFVIGHELFTRFPKAKEGALSRLRAYLVREDTLAELAKELNVGRFLCLGRGEVKSGGAARPSILADCVEALIAAIYLDCQDMPLCAQKIVMWYAERLDGLSLTNVHKDPKSQLQELLQSKQLPLPEYAVLDIAGEEHDRVFVIEGRVAPLDHPVVCRDNSRRKAEQAIAQQILEELGAQHDK